MTPSISSGVLSLPSGTDADLRAQSTTSYDELGRVYRTDTYSVDPSDGSVGTDTLYSETWYDARGQVIKTLSPGGLVQKNVYDGAGRVTVSYTTDGGGDSSYSDADNVTCAELADHRTELVANGFLELLALTVGVGRKDVENLMNPCDGPPGAEKVTAPQSHAGQYRRPRIGVCLPTQLVARDPEYRRCEEGIDGFVRQPIRIEERQFLTSLRQRVRC